MKILICGAADDHNIETIYNKYLNGIEGVECAIFPAHDLLLDYLCKGYVNKIFYRLGFNTIFTTINKKLQEAIEESRPDVVWVFKGMEILPDTIQWIKAKGIKTINFNGDHPFVFSGRGSGNKNVTEGFPLYDAHFTYIHSLKDLIEKEYHIKTFLLPFGYELSNELYDACNFKESYNYCCFIGNPDEIRVSFIRELVKEKIRIDLYGHGWNKYIESNNLCKIYGPVYGADFWKTVRQYRVQLNIFRKHNEGAHNMRTFEIPAVGGLQLAPDTEEHRSFFQDQKEIFLYSDVPDCIQLIQKITTMDDAAIAAIRAHAKERSIKSGYAYKKRAGQAFTHIQSIL